MADSEGKKAVVPLSTSWGLQVPKRRKCNNVIFKDSFEEETNPSIMSSRSSLLPAKATDVKDLQWDPSSMTFSDESSFSGGRKHPRSVNADERVQIRSLFLFRNPDIWKIFSSEPKRENLREKDPPSSEPKKSGKRTHSPLMKRSNLSHVHTSKNLRKFRNWKRSLKKSNENRPYLQKSSYPWISVARSF